MLQVVLATEDELSEAVALRLFNAFPSLHVAARLRRGGNGYLRSRIRNFAEMARHSPVVVLTDLDSHTCAPRLCSEWLRRLPHPPGLLLRVAEREIESWLLADHHAVAALLGKTAQRRLPDHPDTVADPKELLLDLARHATRDIRLDLRVEAGAIARQGLGYNARLCDLVRTSWHPDRAAERSPSLRRTMGRFRELASIGLG